MAEERPLPERFARAGATLELGRALRPRGVVRRVGDGVAEISGLEDVGSEELVAFDSGALGMAYDLRPGGTGILLLSGAARVSAGEGVRRLHRPASVPVGASLLGRVVDPLGAPLDDGPPLDGEERRAHFQPAPELMARRSIDQSLLTGVMVIDAAIPIGRGQRELIVGDRNVGKTSLALDLVAHQRPGDVACVYVIIGQPMSRVLSLRATLAKAGALANTAIIAADAAREPGMQYLAPYAGASVAEWFRDQGRDALVVYDDLTKHADAYRELALLLNRPPGREAYPGDIFYVHAELLERAAARATRAGGGSVTAFPIVETTDSDISAYIPTNLISITDGQIYLDTGRFERNLRPAVDIGRSVSRIGSVAQRPAMRQAARNLRILMSRFESLEALTRVGLDVEESTRRTLRRGQVMRELLRQGRLSPRTVSAQVFALTGVAEGWLEGLEPARAAARMWSAVERARRVAPEAMRGLDGEVPLAEDWKERLRACLEGPA
ncbi:F0F1 ATP synthase subunit alpha [Cystobacter fuscus]|uniref:F0F1 ATP synthase subunit alpha n=1 Tax=Cystobacter fuscus TaxID=43 RepID=UPI0037BE509A